MQDYQRYLNAKQNILDYINDRDKFNRVYYLINENIDILDTIVNETYKNFDYVDKSLVLTFIEHLREIMTVREAENDSKEDKNENI